MRRVFVLEYITGGGLAGEALPAGLAAEGALMRDALLRDLRALPDIEVVLALDARLAPPLDTGSRLRLLLIEAGDDPWSRWAEALGEVDTFWPIAPETGGVLERLARLGLAQGVRLCLSAPDAVALAASKRATLARLAAAGVPHVPCWPNRPPVPPSPSGYVVKPDDGVGAEGVRFIARAEDLPADETLLLQPYMPGAPFSLSLLVAGGEAHLLSCNAQETVREGGAFHYRSWVVGGAEDQRAAVLPLTRALPSLFPGLFGYVGVDLIATPSGPVVLEINPRFTTPYAALSKALGVNVAGLVLEALRGRSMPVLPIPRPTPLRLPQE